MKKTILLSLILSTAASGSVLAQSKMDAGAIMATDVYRAVKAGAPVSDIDFKNFPFSAESLLSRSDKPVSAIIVLSDGVDASGFTAKGVEVTCDLGSVAIISANIDDIIALENNEMVKSISFGELRTPMMDRTRRFTGADVIQAGGEGLSQAYKGAGVVCGIFDTGLDPNHANFLNADKESRVKAVWNYTSSDGSARAYLSSEAISKFTTDTKDETHGTHTLGIMAGAYNGNGGRVATINDDNRVTVSSAFKKIANPYYGMAPESSIMIGCGPLYDANILSGVKKIVDYADELGMPSVVNLSLGGNIGPHDGTDATSRALAELGKRTLIFMAAGNEGGDSISVDRVLGTPANFSTLLKFNGNYSGYIDMWTDTSEPFTLIPVVQDLTTGVTTEVCEINGDAETTLKVASSSVTGANFTNEMFDKAFSSSSILVSRSKNLSTNNRYNARVNVTIRLNTTSNKNGNLVLGFKIVGKSGQHIQIVSKAEGADGSPVFFSSMGQQGFIDGNPDFTISSMACGENIVCVGAWNARSIWPVIGGGGVYFTAAGYELGAPAGYSSYGVLADGRSLPDLVAPGTSVISSISSYYMGTVEGQLGDAFSTFVANNMSAEQTVNGRANYWEAEQGTSMATPAVAGGVALWLQADPTLGIDEVKRILIETANKDELIPGTYPAAKVGAGKFNALDGLKTVLGLPLGAVDITGDASRNFIVTVNGDNVEAYTAAPGRLVATLTNMQGATVAAATADGHSVVVPTAELGAGVYILSVDTPSGRFSRKISIKH